MNNNEMMSEKINLDDSTKQDKTFCVNCGAEIASDSAFCPKCGHKVGERILNTNPTKTTNKKKIARILIAAITFVIILAIIVFARGVQAKDITLNKKTVEVKVGDNTTLTYTINPSDTKNKTVTWTSSNESIAKVNNGTISGINEGECSITVSTKNGKTDTCIITVLPAGPDLQAIYNEYCSSTYATIAKDGSYLTIDTNPLDIDDYMDYEAYDAIEDVNKALGLPESVLNSMNHTRAMDGLQSYSTDELEITWSYHPDNGMEVNYSVK